MVYWNYSRPQFNTRRQVYTQASDAIFDLASPIVWNLISVHCTYPAWALASPAFMAHLWHRNSYSHGLSQTLNNPIAVHLLSITTFFGANVIHQSYQNIGKLSGILNMQIRGLFLYYIRWSLRDLSQVWQQQQTMSCLTMFCDQIILF